MKRAFTASTLKLSGLALALALVGGGAAFAAEACCCCDKMKSGAEMKCCDEMKKNDADKPAPQTPSQPSGEHKGH